jgi:hypothetical protein
MDQYCQTMRLLGHLPAEDEVPAEKVSADALERLVSAFWSWQRSWQPPRQGQAGTLK